MDKILALSSCPDANGQGDHPPILPAGLDWIKKAIKQVAAKNVIIDPLMAFLNESNNSHRDQDIRQVLARMAALADETGAAILVIRHLNKGCWRPRYLQGRGQHRNHRRGPERPSRGS